MHEGYYYHAQNIWSRNSFTLLVMLLREHTGIKPPSIIWITLVQLLGGEFQTIIYLCRKKAQKIVLFSYIVLK